MRSQALAVRLVLPLLLIAGCKPVGEMGSETSSQAVPGTSYTEIVAADHIVWSLAQYLTKSSNSDEKKLASHIGGSAAELYFSSNKDPLYPKAAAVTAAQGGSNSAAVKAFMKREKVRLSTNVEIATGANLKVSATWWMTVSVLQKQLILGAKHTAEMVMAASMTDTDSTLTPNASATFRAFGVDVKKWSVSAGKGVSFSVPMPKLEASPVVYGVPEVGLTAEIGLKPVIKFNLDMDVRAKHIVGFTIIPSASVVAHIGAGAKATKAIAAQALGELDIVAGEWPFSIQIGGSASQNLIYGSATYDGQNFKALQGRLVLVAKVGAANGVLPAGLDKLLWMGLQAGFKKMGINLPNIYQQWTARHVIWESAPLTVKKTPSFGGKAFYKLFNNPTGAKCKTAETIVANHLALLKKESAADTTTLKEASASAMKMLEKVSDKIKSTCK